MLWEQGTAAAGKGTPSPGPELLYYGHPWGWSGPHKAKAARTWKVLLNVINLGRSVPYTAAHSSSGSAMLLEKHHTDLISTQLGFLQFPPRLVPCASAL